MFRGSHLFLLVLLVALVSQALLWQQVVFTDEERWVERIAQLTYDISHRHYQADNPVYSGHPGMSFVTPGALAYSLGVSLPESLRGSVSLLVAFSVAAVALVCYRLRPASMWWLPASIMLIVHPLYLHASPTNAVIAPLSVALVATALWLYEHAHSRHTILVLILWGIGIGLAAATRVVTSALIVGPLFIFLLSRVRWRALLLALLSGVVTAVAVDPLWWHTPWQHMQYILFRSSLNYTEHVAPISLRLEDFILFAPFALLSLILALVIVLDRRLTSPVPRAFIVLLFFITVLFSAAFLSVRYQSMRHFQPLIFLWEIFLPLWVLHFAQQLRFSFINSPRQLRTAQTIVTTCVVVLLAGSQLFLLLYSLALPARELIVDWQAVAAHLSHEK
jgi:4-amino-4-deoxy-L-arabinose transferase-like glycosyltransferase